MSIKISELPVASTIGDNDIIPIVQESTTKSIKYEKFKPTIETTINSSSTNDNPVGAKAVYDYSAPIDHASESTTYGQGTETKFGHCKTINNVTSASYVAGESLSAYQGKVLKDEIDTLNTNLSEYEDETVPELLALKEDKSNKTNTLDENSTETQYPNAKVTYEAYAQLLDQIPTTTATGTTINVQDSSDLPLKDFTLLGNATQQTYTGKNLIPNNVTTQTINGITFTVNSDGTITANGTATATTTLYMSNANILIGKSGTFTISSGLNSTSGVRFGISINNTYYNTNNYRTETFESITQQGQSYYQIDSGKSVSNLVLYPMIVQGSTAGDYEPYTGGKASPNPDYPQDIHVVTGDNTVKVVGDNLFNPLQTYATGYNHQNCNIELSNLVQGQTYYFYANGKGYLSATIYNADGTQSRKVGTDSAGSTKVNFTLTGNESKIVGVFSAGNNYDVATYDWTNVYISTTDSYEPYTEQTQLLSLGNIELAKIGTYTDRIFKDSGKWYVEKNIGKVTFTGAQSESWGAIVAYDRPYFNITITDMLVSNNMYNISLLLSNYFTGYKNSELVVDNVTDYGICRRTNTSELLLYNVDITNVSTLKTWLSTHNTSVYYPLATPTTTEITDSTLLAQLENILKMHTNKNVTNISIVPTGTNAEPTAEVEYRVDLGTVIGNINNAIISLGGNV